MCPAIKARNSATNKEVKRKAIAEGRYHSPLIRPDGTHIGKGKPGPMQGRKLTGEQKEKLSRAVRARFAVMSEDQRKAFGQAVSVAKVRTGNRGGGPRLKAGRGRHGRCRGYYCQSSWELAWVLFMTDHGKEFFRNTDVFEYWFKGTKHRYWPDFKLPDGSYVEVKNYISPVVLAKAGAVPRLAIVGPEEMKPILAYVRRTYGDDFTTQYT